jgi:hypothetical protein
VEVIKRTIFDFHCQSRRANRNVVGFLKKVAFRILRFLYRYRKIILLIAVVVLITLIFNFLIVAWFINGDDGTNGEDDRTITSSGTITVQGIEIYGGDVTVEAEKVYIDWGELSLGASKNASFYVLSTSNVNVTLGLNVTNWTPAGMEKYITISWDYNGTVLAPKHEPLSIAVNLNVASSREFVEFLVENSVTAFGFDMTVYASGV